MSPASTFRTLTVLKSAATSVGDCMRDLDQRDLITGDFVFVTGDVVSNLDLQPILAKHRARREKDKNAIMTMVLREIGTDHRTKGSARRPVFIIDPQAERCLHYEEIGRRNGGSHYITLDPEISKQHSEIEVREDLHDCYIDICTPDVLAQWSDNFDYQTLRTSFLFGVLKDYELNGKTIHTHVLTDQYAARVKNLRAYDAITKDAMARWTFPYSPDSNLLPGRTYKLAMGKNYLENGVKIGRGSSLRGRNVIGGETSVGDGVSLDNCTLGRRCKIGNGVHLSNVYLWDDVVVGNDTMMTHSIAVNNVVIGDECTLGPRTFISYDVEVPNKSTISDNTLTKRKEANSLSDTFPNTFPIYTPTDSDSEAEDTAFEPRLDRNTSASSSVSSISTLTSQISDDDDDLPLGPSSRRSSAFSDPSDVEAAQKNRDFHLEATSSILDGMAEGHAADTIFLELNGYRMSVDAQPHAVLSSVVSAFIKRVVQIIDGGTTTREAVKTVFTKYKALADRVILDKAAEKKVDQIDFLLCVQKEVAGKPKGGELLLFVAKELYDLDLVEEDGVLQWWGDERSAGGDLGEIRGLTEQFVTFLRDAEEDDDDEEEEDEEEEEEESD